MTFQEWWEGLPSQRRCELAIRDTVGEAAWDHQQARIDKLEQELRNNEQLIAFLDRLAYPDQ